MAYAPHILVQFAGEVISEGDPVEVWSIGFRCIATADLIPDVPLEATMADTEEYIDHLVLNALPVIAGATNANVGGQAIKIKTVKANAINAEGKYAHPNTTVRDVDQPFGIGSAPPIYPLQVSKVLTLETGKSRGLGTRGRVYIPGPRNPLTTPSQFTPTANEMLLWANFLDALKYTTGDTFTTIFPAVVSGSGDPEQNWNPITAVSMDSRFDIQRRRANDILGARTTQALP